MKRLIMLSLVILLCTSLVACGDKTNTLSTPSVKENDSVSNKDTRVETYVIQDETLKKDVEELKEQVSSIVQKEQIELTKEDKIAQTEAKYKLQIDELELKIKENESIINEAKTVTKNARANYIEYTRNNSPKTDDDYLNNLESLKNNMKKAQNEEDALRQTSNDWSKEICSITDQMNKEIESLK